MSTLTPKTVSFIITIGETRTKDVAKRGICIVLRCVFV